MGHPALEKKLTFSFKKKNCGCHKKSASCMNSAVANAGSNLPHNFGKYPPDCNMSYRSHYCDKNLEPHTQSMFHLCKLWLFKHLTEKSRLIRRNLCEHFIDMVTAKLFLCFTEYYAMEQCEGVEV